MSINNSNPSKESKMERPKKIGGVNSFRSLIKSTSLLSLGTLSSRILGFLRDVVLATLLGTGLKADAFFIAFRIPNLFRDLVGEGATNAAVVPVLTEFKERESKEEFWRFVNVVLILGMIILSIITILGIVLAPLVVRLIAPGFIIEPEKLLLTIHLTRYLFPYLILIGLTSYCMGILYTFRSFLVPAFTPCLLNISLVVSALIASKTMKEPLFGLAIGVMVGGVLQLLLQWHPLHKKGFRFKWPKTLRDSGAKKIGKLLVPRIFGAGVYQMTVLIDTFCASLSTIVGAGGISAIYYSNRILNFPMGIFSVALASAVLPSLSDLANKKDVESIKKTIVFSLENIFFVMSPTTIILFLMANPIIRVLFQRGEFGEYSTEITSMALTYYAIGLFSFGSIKILVAAFHSLQDTKTPVIVAAICLTINATLNFILMFPLKVAGIALASAIAGTVDFLILFVLLEKRLGKLNSGLFSFFLKVAFASVVAGIAEYWLWNNSVFSSELVKLFVLGIFSFIVYFIICLLMRIEQSVKIWTWISRGFQTRS